MACYNILLKACCLAGRVDLAQDIYREVQHLESTGVLKLDVFTYSTIVKVNMNLLMSYYIFAFDSNMQTYIWTLFCFNSYLVAMNFHVVRHFTMYITDDQLSRSLQMQNCGTWL